MATVIRWGWPKGSGPTTARKYLAIFYAGDGRMKKELSIFVDESGDFGAYSILSPYYIVALVLHDQSVNISPDVERLNTILNNSQLQNYPIHTGPLIRREKEYKYLSLLERKKIFNFINNFIRKTDISYYALIVEKKPLVEEINLIVQLTKQLSRFLNSQLSKFSAYDRIVVYYDYGQMQLAKILVSVFNAILNNVEFKKVNPADYKLCQAADMFCTMELLSMKIKRKSLSKSEISFFSTEKNLHKVYIATMQKKKFPKD